ncbi:MAG: AhpC/TSA family protein [Flavobacteriales bacterium]|nr:AhpC/TSA family protein [Flavobacteriales bacterium]NNK80642.1 AhpC/TSA family protein [Flavobacteriales bacterium]
MYRLFAISAIALIMISSCSQGPGTMNVKGVLENGAGETVYLQLFDDSAPADSAVIAQDGSFQISLRNPKLDFFKLSVGEQGRPVVLVFDSTQTNINITGDASGLLGSYSVSGSKDSELLKEFFDATEIFRYEMDSINKLVQGLPNDMDPVIRMALQQQQTKRKNELETELKQMAINNASSPAALSIISAVDIRNALPEYKTVSDSLKTVIPYSPYLTSMSDKIQQMDMALAQQKKQQAALAKLSPGSQAPDIDLQTPDGKFVSLSSMKGKYVLIDFWASWCGPCRRENPNVVKLYQKYGGKDFEILGVSLDSNKDRWIGAIEKDGLEWEHVSDLKKWNSKAAADYGVRSIPFTVLVDREGKVVATKLRGKALEDKLSEIFGA